MRLVEVCGSRPQIKRAEEVKKLLNGRTQITLTLDMPDSLESPTSVDVFDPMLRQAGYARPVQAL